MGRKKKIDKIREFYSLSNKSRKCNKCEKIFKDILICLKRHLKQDHPEDYNNYLMENLTKTKATNTLDDIENYKVMLSKEKIKNCCVALVAYESVPFNFFNSKAFRELLAPITKVLNLFINAENVKEDLKLAAANVRLNIRNELKNKIFSIKFDEANRLGKSVLGINAQYIKNNEIKISTLGVVELTEAHTSAYLKEIVLKTLQKYELSINQIYSATTDNEANMIKTISLLKQDLTEKGSIFDDEVEDGDIEEFEVIENALNTECEDMRNQLSESFLVNDVRCAAHTMQLCVNDVLPGITQKVNILKRTAIKLRTPKYLAKIAK